LTLDQNYDRSESQSGHGLRDSTQLYYVSTCATKKANEIETDIDTRSIAYFAYEYTDSGKHLRDGVQIEYRPKPLSRLKQDLPKANVAPPNTLFTAEHDGYAPTFELAIVIHKIVKQGKKQRQ
jgi:hypothetical protein